MKNVIVLLANGFEEMEAVLFIDLLRRAGIFVQTVSMNNTKDVTGSRGIIVVADVLFSEIENEYENNNLPDALYLPGGLDGSKNLSQHPFCEKIVKAMLENNRIVAVICAAPIIVLAPLGLLDGKNFTCYPGMEKLKQYAPNADVSGHKMQKVVIDGNLITSQGPGTAAELAFTLIELLEDVSTSEKVRKEALFSK